jgi:hypothetical protein
LGFPIGRITRTVWWTDFSFHLKQKEYVNYYTMELLKCTIRGENYHWPLKVDLKPLHSTPNSIHPKKMTDKCSKNMSFCCEMQLQNRELSNHMLLYLVHKFLPFLKKSRQSLKKRSYII